MKIIWQGFFDGNTGYINASKIYPLATKMAGYDVGVIPMRELSKDNPLSKLVVTKREPDHFVILHQVPNMVKTEGYFTVTEFDVPPPEWWINLSESDIIMTQSKFCKQSMCSIPGIDPDKIHIVYAPVDKKMSPLGPKMVLKRKTKFIFGTSFTWVDRKVPQLMWQAFREEFPIEEYPDVVFVNKIIAPPNFVNWKWIFNTQKQDPRIVLKSEYFNDMGTFYRGLDCYVSATAGEGFGLTLAEAMACGIPTIGSKHSGNLEFMNDDNSWLCDVEDWSYLGNWKRLNPIYLNHDYMSWKLPNVESIKEQMRKVYEGSQIDSRTNNAVDTIKDKCSIQNISLQMKKALDWLSNVRE